MTLNEKNELAQKVKTFFDMKNYLDEKYLANSSDCNCNENNAGCFAYIGEKGESVFYDKKGLPQVKRVEDNLVHYFVRDEKGFYKDFTVVHVENLGIFCLGGICFYNGNLSEIPLREFKAVGDEDDPGIYLYENAREMAIKSIQEQEENDNIEQEQ